MLRGLVARLLLAWLVAAGTCLSAAALPLPLGRFAQPSLTGTGTMSNFGHDVVVERGFKLLYLAPRREGEIWGVPTFAGFFTVLLEGRVPAYDLLDPRHCERGTAVLLAAPTLGKYAKDYDYQGGRVRVTCGYGLGQPLVHLRAQATAGRRPLTVEWLLGGFSWAGQRVPTHWEWWSRGRHLPLQPDARGVLALPPSPGYLLAWDDRQGHTLALLPGSRPAQVRLTRQGAVMRFAGSQVPPGRTSSLPDLWAGVFEAHPSEHLLAILPALATPPGELDNAVGWEGDRPFVEFRWLAGMHSDLIPVPPPFSRGIEHEAVLPTPLGEVAYVRAPRIRIPLALPPRLECLVEPFPALPPPEQEAVAADVRAILGQQQEDGQFRFSLGRPFYDGQVAGVLVQLAPLLEEPLRAQVQAAVRRTLDYWWGRLRYDQRTGVWHLPEPSLGPAVVDYPEISSTLLYPTAAYARLVDPGYARQVWPQARKLAGTVGKAYDLTGSAWAHAGPEYVHILTESTVGGYLAYASLYHLASLAGETQAAQAYRARAAWAYAAMELYRWQPEYGRGGILSQVFGHGMYVEPVLAWDYTMFTWFSWCPLWSLPRDDRYHVWEVLRQQRWWEYYHGSRQLAYDFSHFMALVRFGDAAEGLAHWGEILEHPPSYDNFDTVALYRPLARAWKHAQQVRAAAGRD